MNDEKRELLQQLFIAVIGLESVVEESELRNSPEYVFIQRIMDEINEKTPMNDNQTYYERYAGFFVGENK
jgi:hypothetical protein